jgi:hypothetical protein
MSLAWGRTDNQNRRMKGYGIGAGRLAQLSRALFAIGGYADNLAQGEVTAFYPKQTLGADIDV